MALIKTFNFYRQLTGMLPQAGDTTFGNFLFYPGVALAERLHSHGYSYTAADDFDIAVFCDLDQELFEYAKSLPQKIKKILVLAESPAYCPFPHQPHVLMDSTWNHVLTFNREIHCRNITYYDIPVTGIQCAISPLTPVHGAQDKGVFIARYKHDAIGNSLQRNALALQAMDNDDIEAFGGEWPPHKNYGGKTADKLRTISQYKYSVIIENAKYSGFVTEKIPESILAERPALYFGDCIHARRRYGETFVCIEDVTYEAFLAARAALLANYTYYYDQCLQEKSRSPQWIESFIEAMLGAILQSQQAV